MRWRRGAKRQGAKGRTHKRTKTFEHAGAHANESEHTNTHTHTRTLSHPATHPRARQQEQHRGMHRNTYGEKADSTLRSSQAVPHPSTNRALCCLTSEVERDLVHSTRYGRRRHLRRPICSRMMPVVFSNRDDWSFNKCTVAIRLIASTIPVLRSNCNFLVATRLGERTSTRGDRQMTISYHLTSVSCNRLRRK